MDITTLALARKHAEDTEAREQIAALSEEIAILPHFSVSDSGIVNLYNPALQSVDTIDHHYWNNSGQTTLTSYYCSAPIPLPPGKTYTIGYVPARWNNVIPWQQHFGTTIAPVGVLFFDGQGAILGSVGGTTNTFTLPDNAAYIRFNIFYGTVSVENIVSAINSTIMIVEGTDLPETYVAYGESDGSDGEDSTIGYFELVPEIPACIYYTIEGNSIKVVTKYNAESDLMTSLGEQVGNGLFDFKSFGLIANTLPYVSKNVGNAVIFKSIGTDTHAPFQVKADANADGDNLDGENFKQHFTGGAHQYNNQSSGSTATARLVSVEFIADGVKKENIDGYCNHLEIRWVNHVQGYNTTKADGTGREILQENHRLVFDGHVWKSYVELIALENITMNLWYGFQLSNLPGTVRYVGGANRGAYATTESSNCGNNTAESLINEDTNREHHFEMTLNRCIDLGDGTENTNNPNSSLFSSSYGKSYFRVVDGTFALADGESAYIEGMYRFAAN